jgi:uncharacterized membrane protein YhhN
VAPRTQQAAGPSAKVIAVACLAGLVALILLFPGSGNAAQPPTCYSMFGYVVPCAAWVSWVVAAATAGLVGTGLWIIDSRRQ